jgi:hypothetical protein
MMRGISKLTTCVIHETKIGIQMTPFLKSALAMTFFISSLALALEPDMNIEAVVGGPNGRPVPGQPVWEPQIHVTPEDIAARMQYFDLVVVVNKASSAQTINVYKNVGGQPQEILNSRVSTGVEEYNCHYQADKTTGWISSRAIYTQTPAGYYTAAYVDIDHFSGKYDDAHMPFAVFMYDPTGAATGIATHIAPGGTEPLIGHRASHGCMRLAAKDAQEVFKQVLQTGGPINVNTENMRARCNPAIVAPNDGSQYCLSDPDTTNRDYFYQRWLNANVVQSSYKTTPLVPTLDRSGNYEKDKNDQIKMRPGYKTLYIIENFETGTATTQVYLGMKKVKVKGDPPGKYQEVAVTRPAQTTPITCRSEADLNNGQPNPGSGYGRNYYQGPGSIGDLFGGLFGGSRPQSGPQPYPPQRRQW